MSFPISADCGGILYESSGTIEYPSHNNITGNDTYYSPDENCVWEIASPGPGKALAIRFTRFDLEKSNKVGRASNFVRPISCNDVTYRFE